eukprot:6476153-Amphidinium_carterae.1
MSGTRALCDPCREDLLAERSLSFHDVFHLVNKPHQGQHAVSEQTMFQAMAGGTTKRSFDVEMAKLLLMMRITTIII